LYKLAKTNTIAGPATVWTCFGAGQLANDRQALLMRQNQTKQRCWSLSATWA